MIYKHIGIVGLGLIGSSFAQLVKANLKNVVISGRDCDSDTLAYAKSLDSFDHIVDDLGLFSDQVEIFFIAAPIADIAPIINQMAVLYPQALFTDMGSLKQPIIEAVDPAVLPRFLPGHPMAGSEKVGIVNASSSVLKNANYFLIDLPESGDQTEHLKLFLEACSFSCHLVSADLHDEMVTYTSHMMYFLSVVAALLVKEGVSDHSFSSFFFGSGFESMTRLSQGSTQWGLHLAQFNKENLIVGLKNLEQDVVQLRTLIESEDELALKRFLSKAANFSVISDD